MSEENTTPEAPGLSLGDVAACVRIIDVSTKRGTFEGSELSSVGAIRDRLTAFVEHHSADKSVSEDVKEETEETSE